MTYKYECQKYQKRKLNKIITSTRLNHALGNVFMTLVKEKKHEAESFQLFDRLIPRLGILRYFFVKKTKTKTKPNLSD